MHGERPLGACDLALIIKLFVQPLDVLIERIGTPPEVPRHGEVLLITLMLGHLLVDPGFTLASIAPTL
jgi:hypothetical protein